MAPKRTVKAADSEAEKRREATAKRRRENVVFHPPALSKSDLVREYAFMWGKETRDHGAPHVLPGDIKPSADKYPFFTAYFYCGLVPPFSDFFSELMWTYGFRLLDFTPNAVTCMSVFAHMCENFVGVAPNVALFRHFFIPRIEGDALSGSITWIPRPGSKQIYLEGLLHPKWEEWRATWCWIKEKDFPDYCAPRTKRVQRGKDWSDVSKCDGKLTIALDRITRLRAAGLTIEMVGADFLWRRIAPLQKRARFAWEYKNAADVMRLHTGLGNNLTVLQHASLRLQLFRSSGKFDLPEGVVPLCVNSAKDSILAMMPSCNAHGVEGGWQEPSAKDVQAWQASLTERPTRKENDLIRDTTEDELAHIAGRVAEAGMAGAAGSSRSAAAEDEEEEAADEEEAAEERQEELAGERTNEPAEEQEREEPPVPQVQKKKARVLRKAVSNEPVHPSSQGDAHADKGPAAKATRQQPSRRASPRQPVSAATGGTGAPQPVVPPGAKRARAPSPPPASSGTGHEVRWDLSNLSDEEDEE